MAKGKERQALAVGARLNTRPLYDPEGINQSIRDQLAGKRVAALTAEGDRIASSLPNGHQRSLQLVSSGEEFFALIKCGKKTFEFKGDDFAVTTHD